MNSIIGYKAFNPDFTCRDYKFEVGGTYEVEGEPILCENGFHFCTDLQDCYNYYSINKDTIICEIEAFDYTDVKDNSKYFCKTIHITRKVELDAKDNSKRSCKKIHIKRRLDLDEIMTHITESEFAFFWALRIGNRDVMIDRITESKWAYYWAFYIGNEDIMIDRITDVNMTHYWVIRINDRDVLIDRIVGDEDKIVKKFPELWKYKLKNGP